MQSPTIESITVRSTTAAGPVSYKSRMLERYLWFLAKCERPQVLDVGPVSGGNITFFLEHSSKLFVCDIMRDLNADALAHLRSEDLVPLLDLEKNRFSGIHLWDIADHLETPVLADLVNHFCSLLKPDGVVMMLASNSPLPQPYPSYFIAGSGTTVTLKQVSTRRLPFFFRSNRDMEIVMRPLQKQDSYVCMNGMREFLFKR